MRSRFSVAVWIGQSTSVKPLSLVLNRDRDFSVSSATARHVNALVMILPVAVDYGIFQRLIERYLNVCFTLVHASKLSNEMHESVYQWRDSLDLTREGRTQLNKVNAIRYAR